MSDRRLVLWGMDGELRGNETRLMLRPPFVCDLETGRIRAMRSAADRSLDTFFHDEEEARECGTPFVLAAAIPIESGMFLAVLGSRARHKLVDSTGWIEVQEGFLVKPMFPEDYAKFRSEFPEPNATR